MVCQWAPCRTGITGWPYQPPLHHRIWPLHRRTRRRRPPPRQLQPLRRAATTLALLRGTGTGTAALWRFQFSRLLGYSLLGALAGGTVQGLGWMGAQTALLRPLWTMLHVAALLLGLDAARLEERLRVLGLTPQRRD